MLTEELTTCPICEGKDFTYLLSANDHTVTNEKFQLKKCNTCQFIITTPRPAESDIARYYTSDKYISHTDHSNSVFDTLYLAARKITLRWKHEIILKYTRQSTTLLDYGCGTGDFLFYMKQKGFVVSGIEPNESARAKANGKLKGMVSEKPTDIKENKFEVITLWHVLEHIHQLNETIEKLKEKLSSNGYLFIAVPNPASHDCKKYQDFWAAYDTPRHLWHFTKATMHRLLQKHGLVLVDILPMKLDSYYVSLLSEGYKNPEQNKIITAIKAFSEGLYSNLSARKSGEYSSQIYIVKHR